MKNATTADIKRLTKKSHSVCISLFLPLHSGLTNYQKDEISLKHALDTLKDKLQAVDDPRTQRTQKRIKKQLALFLQNRKDGTVCLFDNLDTSTVLHSPTEIEEQVYVSDSFAAHILAEKTPELKSFYILALSQHSARLFRTTNMSVTLQHRFAATKDVQPMLEELHIDELNTAINTHPTGSGSDKGSHGFHGFGSLKDQRKELIAAYFRKIDTKLLPVLQKSHDPLILAGVGFLLPIYRKVTKYDNIVSEEVHGNMDKVSDRALFGLIKPLVQANAYL